MINGIINRQRDITFKHGDSEEQPGRVPADFGTTRTPPPTIQVLARHASRESASGLPPTCGPLIARATFVWLCGAGRAIVGWLFMVSLWDLLLLLCFTMPIAGALSPAHSAKVGFNGYTVAIVVGVALGLGCSWSMRAIGKKIFVSTRPYPASRREGYFRALYFAGVLWIAFALFLGTWASSAALRFVALHS